MRILFALVLLASLSSAVAQGRRIHIINSDSNLELRLHGITQWQMAGGAVLKVESTENGTRFFRDNETIVEIPIPEIVWEVKLNRPGNCVIVRLSVEGKYSRLVRMTCDPRGRWTVETVLPKNLLEMDQRRRWISEIGAVSDTGRMLLCRVGEPPVEGDGYINYSWQTWLLSPPKKASDGIRVPEGFDKSAFPFSKDSCWCTIAAGAFFVGGFLLGRRRITLVTKDSLPNPKP